MNMLYWIDEVGGRVERLSIELKPFGYRMAPFTQWEILVAAEDVKVEKGKPAVLKIEPIFLPQNSIVGPLSIMRHALGSVLDIVECGIPKRVEDEKCISRVLFMPVESGEIKKGDLVGVLKVFFIKTGLLARIFSVSAPKVEIRKKITEAFVTWRDDGNIYRSKSKLEVFGYARSHIGVWELLVADEDVEVKKGDVVRVNIKEVKLPPNTVVVPLSVMRHALGTVLDVVQLGKPSKVEEEKRIQQAVFLAVEDGEIKRGDLLGVINVYFVGVEKLEPVIKEKNPEKVNLVTKSDGRVVRREITVEPFGYRRSPVARWEVLIANENVELREGVPTIVKVRPVSVPPNTIIYPMHIMRHAYGTVIDVTCCAPWKVEESGEINDVVFLPIMDGEIREGDLLGILNFYSVELGKLASVKQWLDGWVDEMGKAFAESDWPMW
ncbi:MAG: DUF22 domain-containing protein [Archaeoglobaceae archaeon]